ncbi:N-methyl-L-tryptophan oxidase [Streptomyces gamaensis]|uniref:N-methyl-L-tryptophan oxidase n=1 Tax=Streptomyces gamaensis TaxID=1763542 RepID=A0ABW0YUL2_9ACTN
MTQRMPYDVIVLGLGVLGSSTAYRLAAKGHRVLGVERYGPVHDRGASHGETRCVFTSYFMGPRYVPLVRRSLELWEETGKEAGRPLVTRAGALLLGSGPGRLVPAATAAAEASGLANETYGGDELGRRFPQFTPGPDTTALYERDAGFLHVEPAVRAQLDLAERAGAELRFGERTLEWTADAGGVTVRTDQGVHRAARLVLCVGSWVGQLVGPELVPVTVLRKVQAWFAPATGEEAFAPGAFPFWAWDAGGAIALGFPVAGPGNGVKAAMHTGGERCDPETVDRTVHDRDVAELRSFLAPRIPGVAGGRYLRGEVGLYDMSPDRHFIVGRLPGQEHVYLAAGTSGHAFKFAPVIGEALADLATEGSTRHDIGLFDPERFHR